MIIQALAIIGLTLATPARADVSDSGSLTIGGQGVIQGTMTVQGADFSVGGTTFTVAGGSVTLGGRLNAAPAGIKWADGTTSTTSTSGSSSGSAGGDLTGTYPNPTWNPANGITATTGTLTGNSFSVGNSTFVVKYGKVGIGTANPGAKLSVGVNGDGITIGTTTQRATLTLVAGSGNQIVMSDSGAHYTFLIGNNYNVNDTLEITPSSLVGGYSYTTPAIKLSGSNGDTWFLADVSAQTFTDRTPYPKTKKQAYDSVLSMAPNAAGGVDHGKLDPFIRSDKEERRLDRKTKGMTTALIQGRNLSATVSAQNEVIKDLIKRIEALEAR